MSLFIGAVLGVLLGIQLADVDLFSPEIGQGIAEAHPGTMVIGFVILAGLAIAEWLLRGGLGRPLGEERAGVVQVALFLLAGVLIIIGILAAVDELAQAGGALQVVGLFIFLPRVFKDLAPSRWTESIPGLFARFAVVGLVISVALIVLVIMQFTSGADFTEFVHILLAYDHTNFILVMTNIILGLMAASTAVSDTTNRWLVVAVNVGAAGFVLGLLTESAAIKRIFTPILGVHCCGLSGATSPPHQETRWSTLSRASALTTIVCLVQDGQMDPCRLVLRLDASSRSAFVVRPCGRRPWLALNIANGQWPELLARPPRSCC